MPDRFFTPGVYIADEQMSNTLTSVPTAIPLFIGYTEKAVQPRTNQSLVNKGTTISSFAEFVSCFGGAYPAKFSQVPATGKGIQYFIDGVGYRVDFTNKNRALLYNAIRLFYANGGGMCCIFPIGTYGDAPENFTVNEADYKDSNGKLKFDSPATAVNETTLLVMPDAISLGESCYQSLYIPALEYCSRSQRMFAIFDLAETPETKTPQDMATAFRKSMQGAVGLNYGAAYYPWLNTAIAQPGEINFENLDASFDLTRLPEPDVQTVLQKYNNGKPTNDADKKTMQQALLQVSTTYKKIMDSVLAALNLLPPSAAMAGIYTMIDNTKDVWKAPANVIVSSTYGPAVIVSNDTQDSFNVDTTSGISINIIRSFPGLGTIVWGARTMDGNSQDWRYINVRRTVIMIEQSIKLYLRSYVFSPNDQNTWNTIRASITVFLTNIWKQGGLAGPTPSAAFTVDVGLGSTMTSDDLLNGYMNISLKLAIVRPAEFIVVTIQQQMQIS